MMYKILVEALCSCKYAKSVVTRPKIFNTLRISYCVRRYSKKLSASNYIKDFEFQHEQKYGSQTRNKHAYDYKSSKTWSKEYSNHGYEKYARQADNDWNYDNDDNDTIRDGVGIFQEISDEDKKIDDLSGKTQKRRHSQSPNWSDEFGTLATHEDELLVDENESSDVEDDGKEDKILNHFRLARYDRRHIPNWYARRIQKYGKKGEIKKAIEVFDEWMIENDRVKPTQFEYSVLIKLLADVGYTEKAFIVHRHMVRRKIHADDHIYTCLFNACANSPWPEDGLNRAKYLRHKMLYRDKKPTYITYLSMIKAFGFCGDINMAFKLADEAALLRVDEQLLNNLLTACVSDKKAGFRHAIVVWRKFRTHHVKPNLQSYNLLLRCVAECGVGDPDLVKRLFNQPINNFENKSNMRKHKDLIEGSKHTTMDLTKIEADDLSKSTHINLLDSKILRSTRKSFAELDQLMMKYDFGTEVQDQDPESIDDISDISNKFDSDIVAIDNNKEWWQQDIFENSVSTLAVQEKKVTLTNLSNNTFVDILDPQKDLQCSVDAVAIKDNHDRLELLGGMNGILQTLEKEKIKPDIVTFSLLSRSISSEYVNPLISKMWAMGVKPDIVFYNNFMRLYVKNEPDKAWALYECLIIEELKPDIRTFSILAYTCRQAYEGLSLIDDMLAADIMPNVRTMHALLDAAFLNFNYKILILEKMSELGIQCNSKVIKVVEQDIQKARHIILKKEREALTKEHSEENEHFFAYLQRSRKSLHRFLHFYDKWLKKQTLAVTPHPWQAFKPEEEK